MGKNRMLYEYFIVSVFVFLFFKLLDQIVIILYGGGKMLA